MLIVEPLATEPKTALTILAHSENFAINFP